jgi:hypothetical protein
MVCISARLLDQLLTNQSINRYRLCSSKEQNNKDGLQLHIHCVNLYSHFCVVLCLTTIPKKYLIILQYRTEMVVENHQTVCFSVVVIIIIISETARS